jgi:hypothetical protein
MRADPERLASDGAGQAFCPLRPEFAHRVVYG